MSGGVTRRNPPARRRVASRSGLRAASVGPGGGGFAPPRPPQGISGKMRPQTENRLPSLCRPAAWIAHWKGMARMGARDAGRAG